MSDARDPEHAARPSSSPRSPSAASASSRPSGSSQAEAAGEDGFSIADPDVVGRAFLKLGTQAAGRSRPAGPGPDRSSGAISAALWQNTLQRMHGPGDRAADRARPAATGASRTRPGARSCVFDYVKQSYLLSARWLRALVEDVPGLEPEDQEKVDFYTRQFVERAVADQLRRSPTPPCCARPRRPGARTCSTGLRASARRPRARQGRPQDQHDRRGGLRGRRERRHLARQGGLPERADAADPVRADHRAGPQAAAADRAALDQQVLHPGPEAEEQLHQMVRRPGLHGVRDLLGQPARAPRRTRLSRTICSKGRWRRWTRSSRRPASARSTSSATASAAR